MVWLSSILVGLHLISAPACTLQAYPFKLSTIESTDKLFAVRAYCDKPYRIVEVDGYNNNMHDLVINDHGGLISTVVQTKAKRPTLALVDDLGHLL